MNISKLAAHCMKKSKKKKKMIKKANQQYGYGAGAISQPKMMARGGIVKKPTLAMIGEKGSEAVIPLGKTKNAKKDAKKVVKKIIAMKRTSPMPNKPSRLLAKQLLEKKAMSMMLPMPPSKHPHFDDKHMLMKCLKAIEHMSKDMQEEVACGCEFPSWVEYKIYKSKDALLSAIGYTYSRPKAKDMALKVL